MQLVRESASQYATPDYYLGFGIPNLQMALNSGIALTDAQSNTEVKLYPNPASLKAYIKIPSTEDSVSVLIFDVLGKLVLSTFITPVNNEVELLSLSNGLYLVTLQSKNISQTIKLIKQ